MLPPMRSALALLLAATASLAHAQAIPETVQLHDPSCAALPFTPSRLRELVALELEVDGASLVQGSTAMVRVRYEPVPCESGATEFELELTRLDDAPRFYRADMSDIPLATVPRALALELAEALRGNLPEAAPAARAPEPPAEPPPEPPPVVDPPASRLSEPAPLPSAPPTRLGAGLTIRNTPDTGAVLGGARVFIDVPIGHHLPLALRADIAFLLGGASHDLSLGWIDGGLTISIWARALHVVALRFGPRLWLGHGAALNADRRGATRTSGEVQFGVGIVVSGEITVAPGIELVIGGEVGTHFEELEYMFADARSGVIGAYWSGDLALVWSL